MSLKHQLEGRPLLTFIEMKGFSQDWRDLGLDSDALLALQTSIMGGPARAPVIKGTGGLRKIRFAPPAWNVGKSGAVRVCYVYFEQWGIVLLVVAYPKSEQDNLSQEERNEIRQLIRREEAAFSRRSLR